MEQQGRGTIRASFAERAAQHSGRLRGRPNPFLDAGLITLRVVGSGHHAASVLVHLAKISYGLGRSLNFDPATEKIIGGEEAVKTMARKCEPSVVPEKA